MNPAATQLDDETITRQLRRLAADPSHAMPFSGYGERAGS